MNERERKFFISQYHSIIGLVEHTHSQTHTHTHYIRSDRVDECGIGHGVGHVRGRFVAVNDFGNIIAFFFRLRGEGKRKRVREC